jgi:hypothetical protein
MFFIEFDFEIDICIGISSLNIENFFSKTLSPLAK